MEVADIKMETEEDGKSIVVPSNRLLGDGAQSKVFTCADSTTNFIKTFKYPESFEVELKALRTLKGVAGVPVLIAVSKESSALFAAPIGKSLRHYFNNIVDLNNVARSLVCTLRQTHALNIVHRDIGPANIIVVGGQGLLIDWATSTSPTVVTQYQGSTLFASNAVLEALTALQHPESVILLRYEKYMDLESLAKTMFYSMYDTLIAQLLEMKGDYVATLKFWQRCEKAHPRLSALLEAARKCDYEGLYNLFII